MKKLFIIILVLGCVTTANANRWLEMTGDIEVATVDLMGDYTTFFANTSFMVYADLSLSSISMVYPGEGSAITDVMEHAAEIEDILGLDPGAVKAAKMIGLVDFSPPFSVPNGLLVTSTTTGLGTVYLLDQEGGLIGSVLDNVANPEPGTMALLCLGGLLLRRRK